ncbi:MAG TPA: carboxypeptidase-like regulatory domain-containing protein [Pseudobacteroides sp.]|nr:carboxypeptidase-like regulatory domain-containing protein [Pseudobacteroides sp.]
MKFNISISNSYFSEYINYSFSLRGPVIDDWGNSFDTAKEIKSGETISGSVDYFFDSNFFKIIPSVSCKYYFKNCIIKRKIDNSKILTSPSWLFTIYDEEGNKIEVPYYTSDGFYSLSVYNNLHYIEYKKIRDDIIVLNLASNNEYYIEICDSYVQEGSYNFVVSDKLENLIETVTISGYVKPELLNLSKSGFLVSVKGTDIFASTDENGYFQIANVPVYEKGYDIEISKDGYLSRVINNVVVN